MSASDNTWNRRLLQLLEYRVVLGAVATTADGLVVAHAGVQVSDAEVLAAAASQGELAGCLPGSGAIRVYHGSDLALIVLLENEAPEDAIDAILAEQLSLLEQALAA
jgi:hypothetical protein